MSEKIYGDSELTSVRFQCDCMSVGHNMTVSIERSPEGDVCMCSFEPYLAGKPSLSWRIKQAIKCLRGMDGGLGDFILAKRDYPEMVNLIAGLVTNPNAAREVE